MGASAGVDPRGSLELSELIPRYRSKQLDPRALLEDVLTRIQLYPDPAVWITRFSRTYIFDQLDSAFSRQREGIDQPLLGIPFAVKDNIDVAGQPTTAACPAFRYLASQSATVVQRLCDAGAIVVGKTNLDQFATGLVGTRSPFGACKNVFDDRYVSGGSSSGSAVAVAAGLVSFALGTDTAGSGRVPAAFNNLVGLKPSCGRLSTAGVVPACKSLDCVSIFTMNCPDAKILLQIAGGHDPADAYSRAFDSPPVQFRAPLRVGILAKKDRQFFGDSEAEILYDRAIHRFGGQPVEIDFSPFMETAELLYFGPWVAERCMVARDLLRDQPDALLPVTGKILQAGLKLSGVDVFDGLHKLEQLRAEVTELWKEIDLLLLPTTGTIYTREQVEADPLGTNTNLGRYTNFVNLLNLCALAIPAGFRSTGLPAGVSLIAPSGADQQLLSLGSRFLKQPYLEQP